jgi:hypothetical protein
MRRTNKTGAPEMTAVLSYLHLIRTPVVGHFLVVNYVSDVMEHNINNFITKAFQWEFY